MCRDKRKDKEEEVGRFCEKELGGSMGQGWRFVAISTGICFQGRSESVLICDSTMHDSGDMLGVEEWQIRFDPESREVEEKEKERKGIKL